MRTFSDEFFRAILARESGEVIVMLMSVTHQLLPVPIRVCVGAPSIVSRGNEFLYYPFQFQAPDEREDVAPQGRLVVDNVDRTILATLRQIDTPPTITVEFVLASSPDIVELAWEEMEWAGIEYDVSRIEGLLQGPKDFWAQFPRDLVTPGNAPGVFFGGPNL